MKVGKPRPLPLRKPVWPSLFRYPWWKHVIAWHHWWCLELWRRQQINAIATLRYHIEKMQDELQHHQAQEHLIRAIQKDLIYGKPDGVERQAA